MAETELKEFLSHLDYEDDIRESPHSGKQGAFKTGWGHAASGRRYRPITLRQLTWQNLGYRYGIRVGHKTDNEIQRIYKELAQMFK